MKIRFGIFLCALSIVCFSSCDSEIKNARLKRIDSLGTHLNYVSEVVGSVDSGMIGNRLSELNQTGDWVLDNITDTLNPKPGMMFGDYLRCKKFYLKSSDRYAQVKQELEFSEDQLQKLRTDVKNSFYSDEEFKGYFETEADAITKLVTAADELQRTYDSVNKQFEYTKPKVDGIIDSIKNVIYSSEPV